ncbi:MULTISPECIES: hypothetical protein [Tenacibaculum]|uniref:Uncharacterized protein n=1 Tax=Tenacibaculum larymnensis TaxID=2878201 RepID=A0A9X4IPV2_9FLAO|nr:MULTISPECIES: hypothetical protein [Tenacibaculum]MDE1206382.1 hypothetical protein [Tenacibaculum larymnensis]MDX8554304.1 hypothetical protein [Tenacibaculum sp. 1B UA]RLK06729.1 hypothetical protein C8N27_0290 [Tenacibaculum discolor]
MDIKIEKAKEIRTLIENNTIDKIAALNLLQELVNTQNISISELDVYLHEIDNLKKIKLIKNNISSSIIELEENSNQIMEFLSLNNDDFKKLKQFGYKLL